MEKGLSEGETLLDQLFPAKAEDIGQYSPLTLAYIGDAAYELLVRSLLLRQGNAPVQKLHRRASQPVKAPAQARMIRRLSQQGYLSEAEEAVYKRGRNAKSHTVARHASVSEYRMATGFEALMGWLYLKKDYGRMLTLIRKGLDAGMEQILGLDQKDGCSPVLEEDL